MKTNHLTCRFLRKIHPLIVTTFPIVGGYKIWAIHYQLDFPYNKKHGEKSGTKNNPLEKNNNQISCCWSCYHRMVVNIYVVVSTHLKNISHIGSFPQVGMKTKHVWNHHLDMDGKKTTKSSPDFHPPKVQTWKSFIQTAWCQDQGGRTWHLIVGSQWLGKGTATTPIPKTTRSFLRFLFSEPKA